jgi:hypothetical protein
MVSTEKACVKKNTNDDSLAISFKTQNHHKCVDRIIASIELHELTGTLMAVFLFLDANELKAAAEENRRVRAKTNFMVVECDVTFNTCNEIIMRIGRKRSE